MMCRVKYNRSMRRIFGVLFNTLALLALGLCVATVTLWARSYRMAEWVTNVDAQRKFAASSAFGEIGFSVDNDVDTRRRKGSWQYDAYPYPERYIARSTGNTVTWWGRAGIRYQVNVYPFLSSNPLLAPLPDIVERRWLIPHWMVAAVFGIVPLARVTAWIGRRRSKRHGLCTVCGYDLRATPGRCPECGTIRA
jgi:hypothetical protein